MARDGLMAIRPENIRNGLALGFTCRRKRDDGARTLQLECLRHEIILATNTADDAAIFQRIGHDRAKRRHHHRIVDEAGLDAVLTFLHCIT